MNQLPIVKANHEQNAVLILASGQYFFGLGVGKVGKVAGELCFNTALSGYQEILTDPSYTGQIINFTMPHIGNVGINKDDYESNAKYAKGLVVREKITSDSNFRAEDSFNNWLKEKAITGISAIDTRAITNILRKDGAVNALIYFADIGEEINIAALCAELEDVPSFKGLEFSSQVSRETSEKVNNLTYKYLAPKLMEAQYHVVVLDYGVKNNILNNLVAYGARVTIVNCKASYDEIEALNPDGVFLSNGPGDPDANALYAVAIIQKILAKKIPVFGICMGHQLLALAAGLKSFKMHQGHRGVNHPVLNLRNKKVEITSQNHGFCISDEEMPKNVEITHISLFDNSIEGIRLKDRPAFSVQYHPESSSGPHDSRYLFAEFIELMKNNKR
jgi:carbamoyl-phosphate synthase small subunit